MASSSDDSNTSGSSPAPARSVSIRPSRKRRKRRDQLLGRLGQLIEQRTDVGVGLDGKAGDLAHGRGELVVAQFECAGAGEPADELVDLERAPGGRPQQEVQQRLRRSGTGLGLEEREHLELVEPVEMHRPAHALLSQTGEEALRAGRAAVGPGGDQQHHRQVPEHRLVFERRGDVRRERDGCRIGPLQILEDEQCRTVDGRGHERATGVDDRGEARAVLVG